MDKKIIHSLKKAYITLNTEEKQILIKRLKLELDALQYREQEKKHIIETLQNS